MTLLSFIDIITKTKSNTVNIARTNYNLNRYTEKVGSYLVKHTCYISNDIETFAVIVVQNPEKYAKFETVKFLYLENDFNFSIVVTNSPTLYSVKPEMYENIFFDKKELDILFNEYNSFTFTEKLFIIYSKAFEEKYSTDFSKYIFDLKGDET